jgi:hypothetical protein
VAEEAQAHREMAAELKEAYGAGLGLGTERLLWALGQVGRRRGLVAQRSCVPWGLLAAALIRCL